MSEKISAQNTSTPKKSFFSDYFRYKLRTLRGFIILFAILDLLSTAGFSAAVYFFAKYALLPSIIHPSGYGDIGPQILFEIFMILMTIAVIMEVIMLCILPAINFVFFNRRSHMDTLGGLPLTTRQRFLGDMASGAAAFGISFVPGAVIAVIIAAITEAGPVREIYEALLASGHTDHSVFPWGSESVLNVFVICMLTELLCCAAAYAISCFVTSCCGKVGTSVLFSFIAVAALALTAYPIAFFIFDSAIGYDTSLSTMTAFSAIAPVGTLIQTFSKLYSEQGSFAVMSPLVLVILLMIALFTVGAYFAAKNRKTEHIDREIVFKAGYYVIPAIITAIAGFSAFQTASFKTGDNTVVFLIIELISCIVVSIFCIRILRKKWKDAPILGALPTIITALVSLVTVKISDIGMSLFIIPLMLIALGSCFVLAYLSERSVKNIWKGAAVFASSISACFLFCVAIKATDGFGISYYLPSEQDIESVELFGGMITNKIRPIERKQDTLTVKTESGIETILSEHKKLIDDLDNYVSGSHDILTDEVICLTYHYKNGLTSFRSYHFNKFGIAESDRSDYKFVDAVSKIPELNDMTVFGILGNPELPCTGISYYGADPKDPLNTEKDFSGSITIEPSACDRFAECYLNDLSRSDKEFTDEIFATITYCYLDRSGQHKIHSFPLYTCYDNVIEFLKDPANIKISSDNEIDETKTYDVYIFVYDKLNLHFTITHPELAREFFSYVEKDAGSDRNETEQTDILIYGRDDLHNYSIRKENQQAALTALIKAIRAHQAIGG